MLAKARHILGRTDWDKAYCAAAAPEAVVLNPGDRVEISFVPPAEEELLISASGLEITRRAS